MKILTPLLRAGRVLVCATLAAGATAGPVPANPADAGATVPATRYASAAAYRPAPVAKQSPDQNWKALNRTVADYNSMALTMRGAPETIPEAPAPAPVASQSAPPGHAHHDHHEHGSGQ